MIVSFTGNNIYTPRYNCFAHSFSIIYNLLHIIFKCRLKGFFKTNCFCSYDMH